METVTELIEAVERCKLALRQYQRVAKAMLELAADLEAAGINSQAEPRAPFPPFPQLVAESPQTPADDSAASETPQAAEMAPRAAQEPETAETFPVELYGAETADAAGPPISGLVDPSGNAEAVENPQYPNERRWRRTFRTCGDLAALKEYFGIMRDEPNLTYRQKERLTEYANQLADEMGYMQEFSLDTSKASDKVAGA